MKNEVKKLHLNKHTLNNLTNRELNTLQVKGGEEATAWCGTYTCTYDGLHTCKDENTLKQ